MEVGCGLRGTIGIDGGSQGAGGRIAVGLTEHSARKFWARIGHSGPHGPLSASVSRTWRGCPRRRDEDGDAGKTAGQRPDAHVRAGFGYDSPSSRRCSSVGRAAVSQTASRCARPAAAAAGRRHVPGGKVAAVTAGQWAGEHVRAGFGYDAGVPAGVAQLAERPSCKRQVSGSIPLTGSAFRGASVLVRRHPQDWLWPDS